MYLCMRWKGLSDQILIGSKVVLYSLYAVNIGHAPSILPQNFFA